jgi:signal transduction histidine kinase
MKTPSLRNRILFGSVLWTLGLVIMASASLIAMIELQPHTSVHLTIHHIFKSPLVLTLGVFCMAAGFLQVRRGVSPINNLRQRLAGLHQGRDRRIEGTYPTEVEPLVSDLNALLENREQAVRRDVAKAGDLAHGLKTPLAILAHEAERARAAGHPDVAAAVAAQVERMRRQVDYHLAHARAAAAGAAPGTLSSVRESAEGLARAMNRLYAERGVAIDIRVPAGLTARVQREDLDEMIGNLLDNACKWARTRVSVDARNSGSRVEVIVGDDGAGLDAGLREIVLQRGVRADEAAPGSGLGLAIIRDLAEVYGGSIALDASPMGGLRARLDLPARA